MNALLLKDLLVLRSQAKTYALLLGVYVVLTFTGTFQATFFSSMLVVILSMLPLSSFTMDELARWDKYAATLPGGRLGVVKSKFLFLFTILGTAAVAMLVVNTLVLVVRRPTDVSSADLMISGIACLAMGLLVNCLSYPFLFKFGSQKGRIIMMILFVAIFGVFMMGLTIASFGGGVASLLTGLSPLLVALIAAAVLLVILYLSYHLSCKFYLSKDL